MLGRDHRLLSLLPFAIDVFQHDDRIVDDETEPHGQAHQSQHVEREATEVDQVERNENRERDRHEHYRRRAERPQEHQQHHEDHESGNQSPYP